MAKTSLGNSYNQPVKPCAGLFDKIIFAIKEEKEYKKTGNLLFFFSFLLIFSLVALPFSWLFFIYQWRVSGVYYFIFSALVNLPVFFYFWRDFTFSILESFPVI